jgi:hypothetical protein
MSNYPKHTIEISEDVGSDRATWECDCGHAGSCASYKVDLAAEKHVPDGAAVAYRYSAGGAV